MAAAAGVLAGRPDREAVRRGGEQRVRHVHEEPGQPERSRADGGHPGFLEDRQGADEGRGVEDGRGGDLEAPRAGRRGEVERHVELAVLGRAEPAGQGRLPPEVTAVDVEEGGRAGAAVEVLVAAPDGEIDAPTVELVWDGADGVGAVETDGDAPLAGPGRQALQVEELAAAVQDRRQED